MVIKKALIFGWMDQAKDACTFNEKTKVVLSISIWQVLWFSLLKIMEID
jgi:hypothetical protein